MAKQRLSGFLALAVCILTSAALAHASPVLVTFDDLPAGQAVPYLYKGIYWPAGTDGMGGLPGRPWVVDKLVKGSVPRSKPNVMVNEWGVRRINIRFQSGLARFYGAWFSLPDLPASQGAVLIAFLGLRDGKVVGASTTLVPTVKPQFLAYNTPTLVDEIQITAAVTYPDSKRWYNMDNLMYTPVPEPGGLLVLASGMIGLVIRKRARRMP